MEKMFMKVDKVMAELDVSESSALCRIRYSAENKNLMIFSWQEWTAVVSYDIMQEVICHVSNADCRE